MSQELLSADSLCDFTEKLGSSAPVPGGGGATSAVGAVAAALGQMAGHLTQGKPKFAEYEDALASELVELETYRAELLTLVDDDARGYLAVRSAYALPKDDPSRSSAIQEALSGAARPPLVCMATLARVVGVLCSLRNHCSALVLSDVGTAAALAAGALRAAQFSVYANTVCMTDTTLSASMEEQSCVYLSYAATADELYADVLAEILRTEKEA